MVQLDAEVFEGKKQRLAAMRNERQPFWEHWRTLADFYLPRRYIYLHSKEDWRRIKSRNPHILDATGTMAANVLSNGMMNGITSPARPWFKMHAAGFEDDLNTPERIWLDEVERRMLLVMAKSNFYQALATVYRDMSVFGTSAFVIYEHDQRVIHCHNAALGEFYLSQDDCHVVNGFAREIWLTVEQIVKQFGLDNCSAHIKDAWRRGGAARLEQYLICHMIEPRDPGMSGDGIPVGMVAEETYWERSSTEKIVLAHKGFKTFPAVCPRWDIVANDVYGSSPAMDALGDVIQLQHETKKKGQGIDKMMSPPLLADIQLQNQPTSLFPDGITYVSGINNVGVKPAYTVNVPVAEMAADIQDIRQRIQLIFHNDLFSAISQLDTVRSAAEIAARQEEKLVQLGPVLERFETEALSPSIERIYDIMSRKGLLPAPPTGLQGRSLSIQYVSILATAQSAVATAATESWLRLIGATAQLWPEVKAVPDMIGLITDYGKDVGVRMKHINTPQQIQQQIAAANQANAQQLALEESRGAAEAAHTLSQTELGGGGNALQQILGAAQSQAA